MSNRIESPLVQVELATLPTEPSVLNIQEVPFSGYVNIRGKANNDVFMQAAGQVLGVSLPIEANTYTSQGDVMVLWLGPDEWLIVLPSQDDSLRLIAELKSAWGDTFASATDVSGGNTMVEVSGSAARDFLAKGTPLDLHATQFKLGNCAQSVFAHSGATFLLVDEAPTFRVIFRRSFADYLGIWMLDAAREFAD